MKKGFREGERRDPNKKLTFSVRKASALEAEPAGLDALGRFTGQLHLDTEALTPA